MTGQSLTIVAPERTQENPCWTLPSLGFW